MNENKINLSEFIPRSFLGRFIFIMVVFAVFVDVVAISSCLNNPIDFEFAPVGYKKFTSVPAWSPFPIYFVIVYFVIRQSWDAFNTAWEDLFDTKVNVIQRTDGKKLQDKSKAKDELFENFGWWRKWVLIPVAFIAGTYCMYIDSERERATMLETIFPTKEQSSTIETDSFYGRQTTFSGQVARACEDPDFQSKWLWDELAERNIPAKKVCKVEEEDPQSSTKKKEPLEYIRHMQYIERVKNVKKQLLEARINELCTEDNISKCTAEKKLQIEKQLRNDKELQVNNKYVDAPTGQWVTELLMHIEDMILISLGWLIFFQSAAHALFFWHFERLSAAKIEKGLQIRLNHKSRLEEFGLERWNYALNNLYWYFSAALLIPFLSRISQPNLDSLDKSQLILQYAIPIMVATPMILTILARQKRLPECWKLKPEEDTEDYLKQRLWPLDKNWSSKLGILLAFVLLSIIFGINFTNLL